MGRSAVLTGRIDARDRAKLRGRLDVEVQPEADPYDALWAWLEGSDCTTRSAGATPWTPMKRFRSDLRGPEGLASRSTLGAEGLLQTSIRGSRGRVGGLPPLPRAPGEGAAPGPHAVPRVGERSLQGAPRR